MKLPICLVCIKSGILCPSCQEKLDRGEITPLDIEVGKHLLELENKYPALKDATFFKAVDTEKMLIVLVKSDGRSLRPLWNRISKVMSNKIGKPVRIIEKTASIRQIAEQVLAPARVLGVNIVWLPDGSRENYIRVPRSDLRRLSIRKEQAEKVISEFTKETVRIIAE
ncbi:MAG: transcription elongation factor NusA [Candidatus Methanomethylicota archaeon]|uniref:Transcription elongation factor NusA n=1 Tax=Thermoproteota archaeon TaxID=2056631 RepID=A0A497F7Z6_9CREN|nr:MAG: transcription elongation factor NusA [Candidatus Verstraetearchaeota archaeon]